MLAIVKRFLGTGFMASLFLGVTASTSLFALNPSLSITQQDQTIHINCTQDVVSFSSYFSLQVIADLKKQGYAGLKKLKKQDVEKLLDQQNYVELLKSIWAEDNLQYTIEIIQPYAEQGHPILMLEMSRAICRQMQAKNTYEEKEINAALQWYALGMLHTYVDTACNTDRSTTAVLGVLQIAYSPSLMIPEEYRQTIQKGSLTDFMQNFNFKSTSISPKWVLYHGLAILRGENKMLPESEWKTAREKAYQQLLQDINSSKDKENS